MTIELENGPPPEWMIALENKKRNHKLAHEVGAGAPCLKCNDDCLGLDLHFWRKICRNCKCKKELHDVKEENSFEQFQILFGENFRGSERVKKISLNLKCKLDDILTSQLATIEENSKSENDLSFDWIPADVHPNLASEYLQQLPLDKLPITGSAGAMLRRQQLQKQIPLHDFKVNNCHDLTEEEALAFTEYVDNLKNNAVGKGLITKIMATTPTDTTAPKLPVFSNNLNSTPKPFKGFSNDSSRTYDDTSEFPPPPPSSDLHFPSVDLKTPSAFVPYRKLNAKLTPLRNLDEPLDTSLPLSTQPFAYDKLHSSTTPVDHLAAQLAGQLSVADRNLRNLDNVNNNINNNDNITGNALNNIAGSNTNYVAANTYNIAGRNTNVAADGTISGRNANNFAGNTYNNAGKNVNIAADDTNNTAGRNTNNFAANTYNNAGKNVNIAADDTNNTAGRNTNNFAANTYNNAGKNVNIAADDTNNTAGRNTNNFAANTYNNAGKNVNIAADDTNNTAGRNTNNFAANTYNNAGKNVNIAADDTNNTAGRNTNNFAANTYNNAGKNVNIAADSTNSISGRNANHFADNTYNNAGKNVNIAADSTNKIAGSINVNNTNSMDVASPVENLTPSQIIRKFNAAQTPLSSPAREVSVKRDVIRTPSTFCEHSRPCAANASFSGQLRGDGPGDAGTAARNVDARYQKLGPPEQFVAQSSYVPNRPQLSNSLTASLPALIPPSAMAASPVMNVAGAAASGVVDRNQNPRVHFGETTLMGADEELLADPNQQLAPAFGSVVIHPDSYGADYGADDISCHQCKLSVQPGQVVVVAERAGHETIWHPPCFVCVICQELLVDLVYFFHRGEVYCGRHYAEVLKIPRCFACDELIFLKEYTVAEGQTFHIKHFCCFECDIPLVDKSYISKDDNPVCLPCYELKYSKKCNCCGETIRAGDSRVGWKELSWHATASCFRCVQCFKSLLGGKFVVRSDKPLCSKECIIQFDLTVG